MTLGQGQFGSVSKGVWRSPDGNYEVAVKMLKPEASEEDQVKLLQEAAIMGQFAHKNVVKLHGVVTVGNPPVSTSAVNSLRAANYWLLYSCFCPGNDCAGIHAPW